jgi:hypothetical protein
VRWRHGDVVAELSAGPFRRRSAALIVTCRRCSVTIRICTAVVVAARPWHPRGCRRGGQDLRRDHPGPPGAAAFPADHPVAVLGWPEPVGDALQSRPDLEVLAVRGPGAARGWERRLGHGDVAARPVDLTEALALDASHVLVEAVAAGGERVVTHAGTTEAVDTLLRPGLQVWLVAPVGRVLPERLLAAFLGEVESLERRDLELVDIQRFDRIAGPDGSVPTSSGGT